MSYPKTLKTFKNIAGQKFGKLTAIERVENQGREVCWFFRCDCGNEKIFSTKQVCRKKCPLKNCRDCPVTNLTCRKCLQTFPLDFFITHTSSKTGKAKLCHRCYFVRHYSNNGFTGDIEKKVEEILARRKFAAENPNLKYCPKGNHFASKELFLNNYRATCRDCYKKYYENHQKSWSKANYQLKREKKLKQVSEYSQKNAEKIKERSRLFYKNNKDLYRAHRRNRKARVRAAKGRFTSEQWQAKLEYFNHCCYLCGKSLKDKTIHAEHRIPISRGGTNWIANVAPACEKCNLQKHTLTEREFRAKKLAS